MCPGTLWWPSPAWKHTCAGVAEWKETAVTGRFWSWTEPGADRRRLRAVEAPLGALALIVWETEIVLAVMKDLFVNPATLPADWEFVHSLCASWLLLSLALEVISGFTALIMLKAALNKCKWGPCDPSEQVDTFLNVGAEAIIIVGVFFSFFFITVSLLD